MYEGKLGLNGCSIPPRLARKKRLASLFCPTVSGEEKSFIKSRPGGEQIPKNLFQTGPLGRQVNVLPPLQAQPDSRCQS